MSDEIPNSTLIWTSLIFKFQAHLKIQFKDQLNLVPGALHADRRRADGGEALPDPEPVQGFQADHDNVLPHRHQLHRRDQGLHQADTGTDMQCADYSSYRLK